MVADSRDYNDGTKSVGLNAIGIGPDKLQVISVARSAGKYEAVLKDGSTRWISESEAAVLSSDMSRSRPQAEKGPIADRVVVNLTPEEYDAIAGDLAKSKDIVVDDPPGVQPGLPERQALAQERIATALEAILAAIAHQPKAKAALDQAINPVRPRPDPDSGK